MEKRRRRRWWWLVLLVAAVLVAIGMMRGNRVSATFGGREIVGTSRYALAPASLTMATGETTLQLGTRRVVITADKVALDDGTTFSIPADCKRIEVRETSEGVTLVYDGVPVR